MKRIGMALVVVALAPLIMGGGMNPGSQIGAVKITGPAIQGVLVVDTHSGPSGGVFDEPDFSQVTVIQPHPNAAGAPQFEAATKHKLASLWLQKGPASAGAIFRLPISFAASAGCDVSRTEDRFVYSITHPNTLRTFTPPDLVDTLFAQLGVDLTSGLEPVITSVSKATCTPDPDNTSADNPLLTNPGILSLQVVIQFIVP